MATNADRVLKILLKLDADTGGAGEIENAVGGIRNVAGLAVVAGTALYKVITDIGKEQARLTDEYRKQTEEMTKHVDKWIALARAADDFGDVAKLSLNMGPALAQASAQLNAFRAQELSLWQ